MEGQREIADYNKGIGSITEGPPDVTFELRLTGHSTH